MSFFSRGINYSACNEDTFSEYKAFHIRGNESILCILGGGERFFNFLTYDKVASHFVLIDANIAQLHLFELKKRAFIELDYDSFCQFIGLVEDEPSNKLKIYEQIKKSLSPECVQYWDANLRLLKRGLIYQGEFEKFLLIISRFLRVFYGRDILNLFKCKDLDAQRKYFKDKIDNLKWNVLLGVLCRKIWFRLLSKDPCFYKNEGIGNYYTFFKNRFEEAILNIPIKNNFLLALIFCGKYQTDLNILPDCYKRENFNKVKERLGSVKFQVVCESLNTYMNNSNEKFDCFSLSDICSYLDTEESVDLLASLTENSNKGSRIVIRELLTRYNMDGLLEKFEHVHKPVRNSSLEEKLKRSDTSFIWNFYVLCSD